MKRPLNLMCVEVNHSRGVVNRAAKSNPTDVTCWQMLQRVWQELDYRIDICRVTKGGHIEHL